MPGRDRRHPNSDDLRSASARVGPFRLTARSGTYAVTHREGGTASTATSFEHAQRAAVDALRGMLESWPSAEIDGRRIAELIAELDDIEWTMP